MCSRHCFFLGLLDTDTPKSQMASKRSELNLSLLQCVMGAPQLRSRKVVGSIKHSTCKNAYVLCIIHSLFKSPLVCIYVEHKYTTCMYLYFIYTIYICICVCAVHFSRAKCQLRRATLTWWQQNKKTKFLHAKSMRLHQFT